MIRTYSRAFAMVLVSMSFMILTGCGGGDSGPTSPTPSTPTPPTPPAPPPTPVATSIAVTPASHTLSAIGATVQLSATVRDQNNNPMSGQTVNWNSSNTAVATVSGSGLVTAVSNGTAQITARSGNASGTANITVAEPVPTRVTVSPSSHTLEAVGATVQLGATVRDQRNNVMSGQTITWSSGDEAVATVSGAGLVTAVSNGMVDISAKSGSLSASAAITVSQVPAAIVIEVDAEATTLTEIDQTLQLMASVSDANDHPIADPDVTWSSGDESVATVDEDGLVTAVSNGMADITATSGDVSQNVTITVMTPSPDRETLIAIYNATDGPNWTQQENWLSEAPISTWYGITTNDIDRVTKIDLTGVGMAGPFPAELGQLAYLDSLDVAANDLTGSIPVELVQLERLDIMYLSGNILTGPIPAELGQMTSLKEMSLGVNQLSGPIPAELGQMSGLVILSLVYNKLSGAIPPELGQLANLERFHLGENQLSGEIPPEIGQLANLERLSLAENQLSGEIPPEIGQLAKLRTLYLSENELEGAVPDEIGDIPRLNIMRLDGNADLSGELPRSFVNSPIHDLWLHGTQICVPPDAGFKAWVSGMDDAQGITYCEIDDGEGGDDVDEGEDGGDGEDGDEGDPTEYSPWEGVRVESPGVIKFSAPGTPAVTIDRCLTDNTLISIVAPFPPEGVKDWYNQITMDTLTIHYSEWQRSDDMGDTWHTIEGTSVMYNACAYDAEIAGEYRLVGEVTINDDRSFRKSENTFTVDP